MSLFLLFERAAAGGTGAREREAIKRVFEVPAISPGNDRPVDEDMWVLSPTDSHRSDVSWADICRNEETARARKFELKVDPPGGKGKAGPRVSLRPKTAGREEKKARPKQRQEEEKKKSPPKTLPAGLSRLWSEVFGSKPRPEEEKKKKKKTPPASGILIGSPRGPPRETYADKAKKKPQQQPVSPASSTQNEEDESPVEELKSPPSQKLYSHVAAEDKFSATSHAHRDLIGSCDVVTTVHLSRGGRVSCSLDYTFTKDGEARQPHTAAVTVYVTDTVPIHRKDVTHRMSTSSSVFESANNHGPTIVTNAQVSVFSKPSPGTRAVVEMVSFVILYDMKAKEVDVVDGLWGSRYAYEGEHGPPLPVSRPIGFNAFSGFAPDIHPQPNDPIGGPAWARRRLADRRERVEGYYGPRGDMRVTMFVVDDVVFGFNIAGDYVAPAFVSKVNVIEEAGKSGDLFALVLVGEKVYAAPVAGIPYFMAHNITRLASNLANAAEGDKFVIPVSTEYRDTKARFIVIPQSTAMYSLCPTIIRTTPVLRRGKGWQ